MKMKIDGELPDGFEVGHEHLSVASLSLIAQTLLPLFEDALGAEQAKFNVQGIVTELAWLFDTGQIEFGGKTYRPRIAFVGEDGAVLPGAEAMDFLNEFADTVFEEDPETRVSFEEIDDAA